MQYRRHSEIRLWPSRKFYDSKLIDGPNIKSYVIPQCSLREKDLRLASYSFFDLPHGEESVVGASFRDMAEGDFILRLLDRVSKVFYRKNGLDGRNYEGEKGSKLQLIRFEKQCGIITGYSGQVEWFKKSLKKHGNSSLHNIRVQSIDGWQGQERDIVIFSCVRAQKYK